MNHQNVVDRFYQAFSKADGETMAACYADNAKFSDPVFTDLNAQEARGMWRMLCGRSKDLRVEYKTQKIDENHFQVVWDAYYTFTKTGRKVHNHIEADIYLESGKIVKHTDRFSFWRWSRQALGLPGVLLGWTPIIHGKVQKEAKKSLQLFLQKKG